MFQSYSEENYLKIVYHKWKLLPTFCGGIKAPQKQVSFVSYKIF
jgi:hypothetical protein